MVDFKRLVDFQVAKVSLNPCSLFSGHFIDVFFVKVVVVVVDVVDVVEAIVGVLDGGRGIGD